MQERRNSSALAMELRLSCTNPSIFASLTHGMFLYPWRCPIIRSNKVFIPRNGMLSFTYRLEITGRSVAQQQRCQDPSQILLKTLDSFPVIKTLRNLTIRCLVHVILKPSPGPLFYWHKLILIPAWMSIYIHYKVWDELLIQSQTSMVQPFGKFGTGE